jgi:hypothetical protein
MNLDDVITSSGARWGGRPLTASQCAIVEVLEPLEEASREKASTIGLDLAKHVFQGNAADSSGKVLVRKKLRRAQVLEFLTSQPPCTVAMEACGGAPYWGREIGKLGHAIRLDRTALCRRA